MFILEALFRVFVITPLVVLLMAGVFTLIAAIVAVTFVVALIGVAIAIIIDDESIKIIDYKNGKG